MAIYKQTDINPTTSRVNPILPVDSPLISLDRFGLALAGQAADETFNAVDGMPFIVVGSAPSPKLGDIHTAVRGALVGNFASPSTQQAYDIGARIILMAQCLREADLGYEYLEYSTLPDTNTSNLIKLRGADWLGSGDSFSGDIYGTYKDALQSYPRVYDMFTEEARSQFKEHPLIPYRLAVYIYSYLRYYYG